MYTKVYLLLARALFIAAKDKNYDDDDEFWKEREREKPVYFENV